MICCETPPEDTGITATLRRGDVRTRCYASSPVRDDTRPTIVLVHGYPDTHAVWDRLVEQLADDFRCVRYDVRGAGASSRPGATSAYRLNELQADLEAVIDWASPEAPVHVIGHDWGSIQSWEAVTDPRLAHRISSFTSISGPCLDHVGHWLRDQWHNDRTSLKKQMRRSWYIGLFHLPLLPTLAWHTLLARRWPQTVARMEGQTLPVNPTLAQDGANGIKLYRANVFARLRRPRERIAQVPVQIITPMRDAFVAPGFARGLERWVADLTVTPIDAAHWAVLTHPQAMAKHCADFIRARASPALPIEPPATVPQTRSSSRPHA